MEFDRSRVYGAVNADELKAGDKVITARCMADLKIYVEADAKPNIIELIQDETNTDRFTCKHYGSNKTYDSPLAYLVERKENCTNCGRICSVPKTDKTARCWLTSPRLSRKQSISVRLVNMLIVALKISTQRMNVTDGRQSQRPMMKPRS